MAVQWVTLFALLLSGPCDARIIRDMRYEIQEKLHLFYYGVSNIHVATV